MSGCERLRESGRKYISCQKLPATNLTLKADLAGRQAENGCVDIYIRVDIYSQTAAFSV